MAERKMATLRTIEEVKPIPDADKICAYRVGGWWVVDVVGKYKTGAPVVYAEPDAWIPTELAPFLSKGKEPRVYNGVKGEKLRTVKLRGQVSQGLLLDISTLPALQEISSALPDEYPPSAIWAHMCTLDLDTILNIKKYDPPIPAELAGEMKGRFPSCIPKTDQERVQNLSGDLAFWKEKGFTWEKTEKLEGSSMTVYLLDGEFGVCSRTIDLKYNVNNTFWKVADKLQLKEKLESYGKNIAVQGELIGEGIQGNIYKLKGHHFYVYDIYDIDASRYYKPTERREFADEWDIPHVPVYKTNETLGTMVEILASADGKSVMGDINGPLREGEVYKCNECEASFKAISNQYLLKAKD